MRILWTKKYKLMTAYYLFRFKMLFLLKSFARCRAFIFCEKVILKPIGIIFRYYSLKNLVLANYYTVNQTVLVLEISKITFGELLESPFCFRVVNGTYLTVY